MPSPTSGLREVAAAWILGVANASAVVLVAADLLITADADSAVLPIAILPPNPSSDELRATIEEVFEAADDSDSIRGARALELTLRWQCEQYKAGALAGRDLTRWAHQKSHHDGPKAFEPFENLDDEFDDGWMTDEMFIAALDAAVDDYVGRSTALIS